MGLDVKDVLIEVQTPLSRMLRRSRGCRASSVFRPRTHDQRYCFFVPNVRIGDDPIGKLLTGIWQPELMVCEPATWLQPRSDLGVTSDRLWTKVQSIAGLYCFPAALRRLPAIK